jgi:hypothetical protein
LPPDGLGRRCPEWSLLVVPVAGTGLDPVSVSFEVQCLLVDAERARRVRKGRVLSECADYQVPLDEYCASLDVLAQCEACDRD